VDVCVRCLREKIDARAPRHTFIQTRYGVGYSLEPAPKEATDQGQETPDGWSFSVEEVSAGVYASGTQQT
jgi:hypothetical protein